MNKYLTGLAILMAIGGGAFIATSMSKEEEVTKPLFKHVDIENDTMSIHLDIGHTPSKVGAVSASCKGEYFYNMEAVQAIHYVVNGAKHINYEGGELSFEEREKLSISNDLFISIHHDSMNEVYLHKNENGCLEGNFSKGFSLYVSDRNTHYKESLEYAKQIGEYMLSRGIPVNMTHSYPPPKGEDRQVIDERLGIYNYPNLRVVKNAQVPALLIEVGVITNPTELGELDFRYKSIGEALTHLEPI